MILGCQAKFEYDLNQPVTTVASAAAREGGCNEGIGDIVLPLFVRDETVYAANFSEDTFRSIEPGMLQEDVLGRLGEPLQRRDLILDGGKTMHRLWDYAQRSDGDEAFFVRAIEFDPQGKVLGRCAAFNWD
jgi:hypothetical protein